MLACISVAILVLAGAQQAPARDVVAKPAAGATIRGRVTSASTDQPLHRVRITLNGAARNPPSGVTDLRGRFEITDVPAGSYRVTAVRAGYLTVLYGQRRPREAGRPLVVQAGQTIEAIDFALVRGGVLSGRITDEAGDPAAGTRVEALEFRYIRGRRILVPARLTTTNDAGEYRLSGLDPGSYQVRASTTDVWEGDDGKETYAHVPTYFPGVAGTEQPASVNVALAAEVSGLDFHLIAGRAARVAGLVQDANGTALPGQVVNMDRIIRTVGGALYAAGFGGTTKADASGAFELPKIAPGEYQVYAGGPNERASQQVFLGDGEVKEIVLTPRKAAGIAGTVVTDDGVAPSFSAASITVVPITADPTSVLPIWNEARPAPVHSDWSFTIPDLDGQYLLRVDGLPEEWRLKAVTLGDRDVTDAPIAIARGSTGLSGTRVVLTRHGAKLRGDAVDAGGRPFADATVIVFAADPAKWGVASRFVRSARPDERGHFSFSGLPAGVYRIIAREAVTDGQWEDASFLQSLVDEATQVDLAADASEAVTLKVARPQ
jgi:hypothetical protein